MSIVSLIYMLSVLVVFALFVAAHLSMGNKRRMREPSGDDRR
jgi:hypothetical protein